MHLLPKTRTKHDKKTHRFMLSLQLVKSPVHKSWCTLPTGNWTTTHRWAPTSAACCFHDLVTLAQAEIKKIGWFKGCMVERKRKKEVGNELFLFVCFLKVTLKNECTICRIWKKKIKSLGSTEKIRVSRESISKLTVFSLWPPLQPSTC